MSVNAGDFPVLIQTTGQVAVDTSGTASFSDMVWGSTLQKLYSRANWRFYLTTYSNFSCYNAVFNLTHKYTTNGVYNLTLTLPSLNIVYQEEVIITNCKLLSISRILSILILILTIVKNLDLVSTTSGNTFDKTLNDVYMIYTDTKNDSIIIDYGDSTEQILQINAGFYLVILLNL